MDNINTLINSNSFSASDLRLRLTLLAEKQLLVARTYEAGSSVSLVARAEGVSASLLFKWRALEKEGKLFDSSAGGDVVPATEIANARSEIAKLQKLLGKKSLQIEILEEFVQICKEKKWLAPSKFPKVGAK